MPRVVVKELGRSVRRHRAALRQLGVQLARGWTPTPPEVTKKRKEQQAARKRRRLRR